MSVIKEWNDSRKVQILYTNHRGETAWRIIEPKSIYYGTTPWHLEPQWLLLANDVDKKVERDFAIKDIKEWRTDVTTLETTKEEVK